MNNVLEHNTLVARVKNIWTRFDLSIGCDLIDAQHMWLVAILIQVDEIQNTPGIENSFAEYFSEVIDYTSEHFDLEEGLLRESNYIDTINHARQHMRFLASIKRRGRELSSEDSRLQTRLVQTLKKWIFSHILSEDKKYRQYFQSNGIDMNDLASKSAKALGISLKAEQKRLFADIINHQISENSDASEDNIQRIAGIWNKYNLRVNIPIIDMQHLWLIRQIVDLDRVLRLDTSLRNEKFQEAIVNGIDYVKEHFSAEEKMMRNFAYPNLDAHMKQHREFVDFIQERHRQSQQEDIAAYTGLIHDLKEWLISHIAVEDKKLYYFFRKRERDVAAFARNAIKKGDIIMRKGHMDLYQSIVQFKVI